MSRREGEREDSYLHIIHLHGELNESSSSGDSEENMDGFGGEVENIHFFCFALDFPNLEPSFRRKGLGLEALHLC